MTIKLPQFLGSLLPSGAEQSGAARRVIPTRRDGAVIGVMVAVALLPPLVIAGLLLGAGYGTMALGAGLLVLINIAGINLSGVVTFLAQQIRPRQWWEADQAKTATRYAMLLWAGALVLIVALILLTGGIL